MNCWKAQQLASILVEGGRQDEVNIAAAVAAPSRSIPFNWNVLVLPVADTDREKIFDLAKDPAFTSALEPVAPVEFVELPACFSRVTRMVGQSGQSILLHDPETAAAPALAEALEWLVYIFPCNLFYMTMTAGGWSHIFIRRRIHDGDPTHLIEQIERVRAGFRAEQQRKLAEQAKREAQKQEEPGSST
jgi:hypothetical protein